MMKPSFLLNSNFVERWKFLRERQDSSERAFRQSGRHSLPMTFGGESAGSTRAADIVTPTGERTRTRTGQDGIIRQETGSRKPVLMSMARMVGWQLWIAGTRSAVSKTFLCWSVSERSVITGF
jgi:hypothetical protein